MNSSCPHLVALHSVNCSLLFKWSLFNSFNQIVLTAVLARHCSRHWLEMQWLLWSFVLLIFHHVFYFSSLFRSPLTSSLNFNSNSELSTKTLRTYFLIRWHHPLLWFNYCAFFIVKTFTFGSVAGNFGTHSLTLNYLFDIFTRCLRASQT